MLLSYSFPWTFLIKVVNYNNNRPLKYKPKKSLMKRITVLSHLFTETGLALNKEDLKQTHDLGKGIRLYYFIFRCYKNIPHSVAYLVWEKNGLLHHMGILNIDDEKSKSFSLLDWEDYNLHLDFEGEKLTFSLKKFLN